VSAWAEFQALEASQVAAQELRKAALALNPCPFCGGTSQTRDRFTHAASCVLVPFLDETWPDPSPVPIKEEK